MVLRDFKMSPATRPCQCSSGACCDGCNFKSSTATCRASTSSCDPAEKCSGTSASCPADVNKCGSAGELVAFWHLDEGRGTQASDASDHGIVGTLVSMRSSEWVAGLNGKALKFLKNAGLLKMADPDRLLGLTGDASWSIWLKFTSLGWDEPIYKNGVFQLYHLGDSTTGASMYWTVQITDSSDKAGDSQWNGQAAVLTNTKFAVNSWYHVVGVRAGNDLRVYVNGNLDKSLACLAGKSISTDRISGLTVGMFTGMVDDMSVYRYALSASQVRAEYNKYSART